MKNTIEHIEFIEKITSTVLAIAGDATRKEVIAGFVLSAIEKLNKINSAIKILYSKISCKNDVEFSVGILLRSLMMDCIQTQYLAASIENNKQKSSTEIKAVLQDWCLKFLSDGTASILNNFLNQADISNEEKENFKTNVLKQFSNIELKSDGNYKGYKVNLTDIDKELKNECSIDLTGIRNEVFDKYKIYSQYDHLSFWTAFLNNKVSFTNKLNSVNGAIFLLLQHLRTLLFIGYFYGDKKMMDSCLLEVENFLNEK